MRGDVGRGLAHIAALATLVAGPVGAHAADVVPTSQAAFRAEIQRHFELAKEETQSLRFVELERARDAALAQALGEGLAFQGWIFELRGIEPTPGGGYFVRFLDPAFADHRLARPTFWNGGPGRIASQAAIRPGSALYDVLKGLKPGNRIAVSGYFYPNANGGPVFEAAQLNYRENAAALAKFRAPYFAVRVTEIRPP